MKPTEFDQIVRETLAGPLAEHGFSLEQSKRCTFSRQVSPDVWHFIIPDPMRSGFDVKVFPTSPIIDPSFAAAFPDDVAIPTDIHSFLSEKFGVGRNQQIFPATDREGLRRVLLGSVLPTLSAKAIPYLKPLVSIHAIAPLLRHPASIAFALSHLKRHAEAKQAATAFVPRLRQIVSTGTNDPKVKALVERFRQVFPDVPL